MRGSTDADVEPVTTKAVEEPAVAGSTGGTGEYEQDAEEFAGDARRARWLAVGTGALLACAGLAAALLRSAGTAPALVPAAYALGAAVCVLAAVLGGRGRTRRALWLLIAGTMIMALGDQFD
ncbi:hypothetical protein ABZ760_06055 [Streptomyces sp. NPDC006658]|uniref:hypothetical protein n=1 Tax=Streptomyces sp. NPDC006658 TaxID=3156900 RepID=UPI0034045D9B